MIRRPVIAPGLHVLTDPAGVVQLGLAPGHRLRVPDTPAVRRTLAVLARGEPLPPTREAERARSILQPALRDGDALVRPGIGAADVAAVALQHPHSAAARLAARARARIEVVGDLGIAVGELLRAVGLAQPTEGAPTAVLMLSRGEPRREPFDVLTRTETPHLVVRAVESEIVLGPFVAPGATACLRCCDLHLNDREPGYHALLADAVRARRSDGVCDPVDSAQCWIALGRAVADLVRHVEGDRPSTWSSTVRLDAASGTPHVEHWPPHPDCSCTWMARRGPTERSATMDS